MKWFCKAALCVLAAVALFTPAYAQKAAGVLEDAMTGSLASKEDVRWHPFEMAEDGDAVIWARGLQDHWDGYAYHWRCAVFAADQETKISEMDVRGYSEAEGPAVMPLPNLPAGTYYIRMTSTSSGNPFLTAFTTEPYELKLLRVMNAARPAYAGDGVQTFSKAGEVLWNGDGTVFIKRNDGVCYGALVKSRDGAVIPVLIGEEPGAVEYIVSETGQVVGSTGPWKQECLGIDYYISDGAHIKRYTEKIYQTESLPIFYVEKASAAAEAITDELGRAEYGALRYWWMKHKDTVIEAGGVLLGLILIVCVFGFLGGGGGGGGSENEGDDSGDPYMEYLANNF